MSFRKSRHCKPTTLPEEILTVEVNDLSRGGAGVARDAGGRVIFIPFTAPGDLVRVRVVSAQKRYAQGELVELLKPSAERVVPPCRVFGRCGGCQWQHLDYSLQWKTKSSGVRHALARVSVPLPEAAFDELPAERIWEYRNRIQLRGENGELGFYATGSHEPVWIERCEIARPELNALLPELRREGEKRDRPWKVEVEVFEDGTVARSWNRGHAALGFRQVHDEQNLKLQRWVTEAVTPGRPVLDLFGGRGNLSFGLAQAAPLVDCVDVSAPGGGGVDENVLGAGSSDPEILAKIRFHRTPVLPWLAARAPDGLTRSAVLDPPREGLGTEFAEIARHLERLGVDELVAVGCDVDAWARDVSRWVRNGWRLERAGALDLFPQTTHVESLALLTYGREAGRQARRGLRA